MGVGSESPDPPRWRVRPADPAAAAALQAALGIPPLLAVLLLQRGCVSPAEARDFLEAPLENLHDPWRMAGMPAAVERLRIALAHREPIRICGDYDVDGVAGTALLVEGLTALGGRVSYRIPHRVRDGYGVPVRFVEEAKADGVGLLLAVDAGISAHPAAERARALSIDLIVCDHHQPPAELPPAAAILNPRQPACDYPFKELCGAGIAFKLLQALDGERASRATAARLPLVALATIADVVPLLGENRILVRHGLARMGESGRPGLAALVGVAGFDPAASAMRPGQVAFGLAPRLNAAGRMEEADLAVRLLLTPDAVEGAALAARLDGANRRRQAVEGEMLEEAVARVEAAWAAGEGRTAILLASADWHPGVLGIVASRLVERFRVPAALAALLGEEARGSIRSPGGFHVADSLRRCGDLLEHFGGHAAAGGFSLPARRLPALKARLLALTADSAEAAAVPPPLMADAEVELASLDLALADALARLAPHGMGNPEPVLLARGLQVMRFPRRVGRNHLKMRVRQAGAAGPVLDSIGFNLGELAAVLDRPTPPRVDLAFTPERNSWNGRDSLQLRLREVVPRP